MGCCQAKQYSKNKFIIPDIVIEEYVTNYSVDVQTKVNQDYNTNCIQYPSEWFIYNCDRNTADYLLRGKPDGTFLIRESSLQKGEYMLAVSLHHFVHHLLIFKTERGFGLLQQGMHPSLLSLISYYSQVSLKTINPVLDTKLIEPIFANK